MQILIGLILLASAGTLMRFEVGPVPTWFYVCAWYPLLLTLDSLSRQTGERSWLWGSRAISLGGWSVVLWLVYEAANFRLQNWYYVGLPHHDLERWIGIVVSFATVLPALFLTERLLDRRRVGVSWDTRKFPASHRQLRGAQVLGAAMAVAALTWPAYMSPMIWGAGFLLLDPLVYQHRRERSLLADLTDGRPGRIGRLVISGFIVGLLWEGLNYVAVAKWIYTVPFLEDLKLFEMPPLGFVGFPVFTLSAYSAYHALVAARVAVDPVAPTPIRPFRTLVTIPISAVFVIVTLHQMDYRTVSSTVVPLSDVPGIDRLDRGRLEAAGIRVPRDLLPGSPGSLARRLAAPDTVIVELRFTVQLMTLRGLGARHARELARAGIHTVCQLARDDPAEIWQDIHGLFRGLGPRPTAAEVRVWHRAARRVCPD